MSRCGAKGGESGPASPSKPPMVSAKYAQYSTYINRLHSFTLGSGWPGDKLQKPEDIAMAGLFFAGVSDCTRCFSCGGGLRNWLPGDIPAVEHARFFPNCEYILRLKGAEFVANVDVKYPKIYPVISGDVEQDYPSSSQTSAPNYDQIIESVLMKPCGQALDVLGFSPELVRAAVTKVLSENDWNDSLVTSEVLASACFELQEADVEEDVPDIDVPDQATGGAEKSLSLGRENPQSGDVVDGPPSPTDLSPSELERLRITEENRRLKDTMKCKICLDKDVAVVYLPCGHLVTCTECYSTQRRCPLCRTKIVANVRTYI